MSVTGVQFVAPFSRFMENNSFLTRLDLENSGAFDVRGSLEGAEMLLRGLHSLPHLEYLNLRRCFPQVIFFGLRQHLVVTPTPACDTTQ